MLVNGEIPSVWKTKYRGLSEDRKAPSSLQPTCLWGLQKMQHASVTHGELMSHVEPVPSCV